MDFYDLLKEAAKNKQKAANELEGNKRYNLSFKPMKKISRPKVNKAAINAQIKKKEEEQKKKAEQEEKEKQKVLALRAEQEAAKTAKKRRDSSSDPPKSTKSEKAARKKKNVKQDGQRDDRQERESKNHSFPKEEKYKDFRLNSDHEEEEKVKTKSKSSKLLPDAKPKTNAPSFKELMNIAASNAGSSKPSFNGINNHVEKCQPDVKLKTKADSRRENSKSESQKSFKRGQSAPKYERSSHKHKNLHREPPRLPKTDASTKVKKTTLFPNTKDVYKPKDIVPSRISHEVSQKSLSGKLSKSSVHETNVKRAAELSKDRQKVERKNNVNQVESGSSMQKPVKRKGGWLDAMTEPKRTSEELAAKSNGAAKHVIKPKERKGVTASEMERPKEKKRGWLDAVPKTTPVDKVAQSEFQRKKSAVPTNSKMSSKVKKTPPAPRKDTLPTPSKEKKRGILDAEVAPASSGPAKGKKGGWLEPPSGKKGGWLDPPSATREERGGWLGPVQEPSEGRVGGWLGSVREPQLQAKRGRLLSSEDEEDDSDMDDFIDDTPFEGPGRGNVSSYIKEIFGYDRSTYQYESDYALKNMDASYSQILKEEAHSTRIAQEEDAEEFRKEKLREKKKLEAKAKRR